MKKKKNKDAREKRKKEKRTWAAQTDWDHPTDPACRAVCGTNQGLSKGWGSHGHVNHDNNTDQRATLCFFLPGQDAAALTMPNAMGTRCWLGLRGPTATAAALLENHGLPGIRPVTCLHKDLKCCPAGNKSEPSLWLWFRWLNWVQGWSLQAVQCLAAFSDSPCDQGCTKAHARFLRAEDAASEPPPRRAQPTLTSKTQASTQGSSALHALGSGRAPGQPLLGPCFQLPSAHLHK